MQSLPSEVLQHVASFMDTRSKVCLESTCNRLRGLINTAGLKEVSAYVGNVQAGSFVNWLSTHRLQRIECAVFTCGDFPRKILLALLKQHETLEEITLHFLYGCGRNWQLLEVLFTECTKLRSFSYLCNNQQIEGK